MPHLFVSNINGLTHKIERLEGTLPGAKPIGMTFLQHNQWDNTLGPWAKKPANRALQNAIREPQIRMAESTPSLLIDLIGLFWTFHLLAYATAKTRKRIKKREWPQLLAPVPGRSFPGDALK
jgi:hypothetical protein